MGWADHVPFVPVGVVDFTIWPCLIAWKRAWQCLIFAYLDVSTWRLE